MNSDVVDMVVVVVAADGDAVRVLPNQHRMVHRLACPAVSSYCNQDLVPKVVAVAYRNPTRQDKTEHFNVIRHLWLLTGNMIWEMN